MASTDPILITGGEGFIGKHLQEFLQFQDVPYLTLDSNGNPDYPWDISLDFAYDMPAFSRVIHLAGLLGTHELFDQVQDAIDVNIKGTANVLELCRLQDIPFTGVTMAHVWVNPYETTKLAAERLAAAWSREYGFSANYVTVYNAFGEYQAVGPGHPQKIIPTFARAAWEQRPIPIWGDGSQIVDLVYARHVAQLLYEDSQYDGGYGNPLSVLDVAHMVWSHVNPDTEMLVDMMPMRRGEHPPSRHPVATMPVMAMNWVEFLRQTIDWYEEYPVYPVV